MELADVEGLLARLEGKRDEKIALTQALVRVPTVNPPGDAYDACAELVGERLRRRWFDVLYVRGEGAPGDSERHPRVNVVARRESGRPGRSVRCSDARPSSSARPGPTTRSTSPGSGTCTTASPTGRAASTSRTSRTSSSRSTTSWPRPR